MATTTAARVNGYLAGTGVVLGTDELAPLIADADLWFDHLVEAGGISWNPDDWQEAQELAAKSFFVLSQIAFAPFSFRKGDESKDVNLTAGGWWSRLQTALEAIGLATAGEQAVGGVESGVDYPDFETTAVIQASRGLGWVDG